PDDRRRHGASIHDRERRLPRLLHRAGYDRQSLHPNRRHAHSRHRQRRRSGCRRRRAGKRADWCDHRGPRPLSSKLTVINQVPISGGTVKKVSYLSADDQSKAKQALLDRLTGQAMDKINEQIARNETFILSPAAQGDRAIEELTYEESPEQVTTRTTLHMKVLVKGLTFLGDDVNAVIEQTMETAAARQGGGAEL